MRAMRRMVAISAVVVCALAAAVVGGVLLRPRPAPAPEPVAAPAVEGACPDPV